MHDVRARRLSESPYLISGTRHELWHLMAAIWIGLKSNLFTLGLGICYISNGDLANGKKMHLMEIRLVLEERLDHARLVVLSGEVERRVAVSVLHVDVGEDVPDHGHELESIVTNKRMSNSERT